MRFFAKVPAVYKKLKALSDVGLGYIHLGQPATTLSGGEAQRVKLASSLARPATGRTMYILDEPTTGLHCADIERLLQVLQRLVEAGNSVIVVEHNLEVVKSADWIIDLGPGAGDSGDQPSSSSARLSWQAVANVATVSCPVAVSWNWPSA